MKNPGGLPAMRKRTNCCAGRTGPRGSTPKWREMRIAIIGLGYVGLPLCLQFARSGVTVIGLDIDQQKVEAINRGKSYIEHIDGTAIEKLVAEKKLSASTEFSTIKQVEAVIVCVPTPLNKNREPD